MGGLVSEKRAERRSCLATAPPEMGSAGGHAIAELVRLRRSGKPFGFKPGLELHVCKPPGVGASLNQDFKMEIPAETCAPLCDCKSPVVMRVLKIEIEVPGEIKLPQANFLRDQLCQ
jgi:hypothetical protein